MSLHLYPKRSLRVCGQWRRAIGTTPGKIGENKRELYDRILRVDHAGEFGADRIYAGEFKNCLIVQENSGKSL